MTQSWRILIILYIDLFIYWYLSSRNLSSIHIKRIWKSNLIDKDKSQFCILFITFNNTQFSFLFRTLRPPSQQLDRMALSQRSTVLDCNKLLMHLKFIQLKTKVSLCEINEIAIVPIHYDHHIVNADIYPLWLRD